MESGAASDEELAFPGSGRRGADLPALDDARRIAELERKIGQLTMENDFLKKPYSISGIITLAVVSGAGCLFGEIQQARAKG